MLADMLVAGAIGALIVGGQFGHEGEHDALVVDAEDDDGGVHWCHSTATVKPCPRRLSSKSAATR